VQEIHHALQAHEGNRAVILLLPVILSEAKRSRA